MRVPLLLSVLASCTNADLRDTPDPPPAVLDDKLSIQGHVCTSDPSELTFPVKVIFVIDSSQSMNVSDPVDPADPDGYTGRQKALRDVVAQLLGSNPEGIGIGIVSFAGSAQILTQCDTDGDQVPDADCFTNDPVELESDIELLGFAGSVTSYSSALALAFSMLSTDMQGVDEVSLARSKYAVVFLSDGLPDTDDPEETRNILGSVEDMVELAHVNRVGSFSFNTAYLSTFASPEVAQAASELLRSMAEVGEGTTRSFPNGEAINFLEVDLTSMRRAFSLSTIVATNTSAMVRDTTILVDTDHDFLPDDEEDADGDGRVDDGEDANGNGVLDPGEDLDADGALDVWETDPLLVDTDGYGFSDGLEVRLEFNPRDPPDMPPPPARPQPEDCALAEDKLDTDGDGFRDCEERFYGTSRLSMDSDRDGLPGPVEVRFGTNPVDDDAEKDADFDRTSNGQEVRTFGDPRNNDATIRAERSYRYQVLDDGLDGARSCRDFRIDNITLVETLDDGWNLLLVYAGQVPFDDPGSAVDYRVACVLARFQASANIKDPPGGFIELDESDFHLPTEIDPNQVDPDLCVGPPR
ncbi:MAG: VWA domain-containing protein [Deltaproteobacteria bacterium]|nr:VWA domain-containing protein [Deltaproteobacteria bacterium]